MQDSHGFQSLRLSRHVGRCFPKYAQEQIRVQRDGKVGSLTPRQWSLGAEAQRGFAACREPAQRPRDRDGVCIPTIGREIVKGGNLRDGRNLLALQAHGHHRRIRPRNRVPWAVAAWREAAGGQHALSLQRLDRRRGRMLKRHVHKRWAQVAAGICQLEAVGGIDVGEHRSCQGADEVGPGRGAQEVVRHFDLNGVHPATIHRSVAKDSVAAAEVWIARGLGLIRRGLGRVAQAGHQSTQTEGPAKQVRMIDRPEERQLPQRRASDERFTVEVLVVLAQVILGQPVAEFDQVAAAPVGVQVEQQPAPTLLDHGLLGHQQKPVVFLPCLSRLRIASGPLLPASIGIHLRTVELIDDQVHWVPGEAFNLGAELGSQLVGIWVIVDHCLTAFGNRLGPQRTRMRQAEDDGEIANVILGKAVVAGDDLTRRVIAAVDLIQRDDGQGGQQGQQEGGQCDQLHAMSAPRHAAVARGVPGCRRSACGART